MVFLYKSNQLALAKDGVAKIQSRKLDLLWMEDFDIVQIPVVKRAMVLVFQGANGMRDLFNRIGLAMGKIVHGIDFPLGAGSWMCRIQDTIHDRGRAC